MRCDAKLSEDWCHWCGKRTKPFAEVSHDSNAEHPTGQGVFVRVCLDCLKGAIEVIHNEMALDSDTARRARIKERYFP